mgnify:CR=1 FL=1
MVDENDLYKMIVETNDSKSLEILYDRYESLLFNLAYKITQDVQSSEEVLQDVFMKIWNKKAEISKRFSSIQDYILEYCNFGCPYFVVRRLSPNEFIEEIDDKEDIIDKLHDVKIQPTIQDTEKHTQAIDQ